MTLLPHENWNVIPVRDRAAYKVNERCAAPGCTRFSDHSHHLWRRSHGTNEAWVCIAFLPDKPIIGNLIGLCTAHHDQITGMIGGHEARIAFVDDERKFYWVELPPIPTRDEHWIGPLKFQPPGIGAVETASPAPTIEDSDSPDVALAEELDEHALSVRQVGLKVMHEGRVFDGDEVADVMTEAAKLLRRRAKRKAKKEQEESLPIGATRHKKTWTVKVPDDGEDGYAVLNALVESAAEKLGRGNQKSSLVRYFTLVEALVFLLQNEVDDGE